ncbi:MAG: SDR family oxidoreductase [Burkholderiales bacterium]|nr:SDR family oxidoreductase [Burkholderiales bacterium]
MRIIVTGASKGLGKVLAEEFALRGHQVGLLARSVRLLDEICGSLATATGKQNVHARACDLSSAEEVQTNVPILVAEMGGVDVLINNASSIVKKGLLEMSADEWRKSMSTGIDAAFHCARAVMPYFLTQGGGHIINISSLSTKISLERGVSYSASKHALNGFSKSMVHELHRLGIKVCTIHPGAFTVEGDDVSSWKMPATEVFRACEYVVNSHPKAFVEELVVRPLTWPE